MTNSDQSLSVVLPVYNAQNSLPHLINQMLDILPDVATEFEVLVVDDGSTDQTEEVARDLAIRFPQVRVVHHARRLGGEAVIQTGYQETRGKVVIVQQENTAFGHTDLQRVWQLHTKQPESEGVTRDPQSMRLDPATEDYLTSWSAAFRNRMKPPSPEQLEAMQAELPETPPFRADSAHVGNDPAGSTQSSSRRLFGPPQPRQRTARR